MCNFSLHSFILDNGGKAIKKTWHLSRGSQQNNAVVLAGGNSIRKPSKINFYEMLNTSCELVLSHVHIQLSKPCSLMWHNRHSTASRVSALVCFTMLTNMLYFMWRGGSSRKFICYKALFLGRSEVCFSGKYWSCSKTPFPVYSGYIFGKLRSIYDQNSRQQIENHDNKPRCFQQREAIVIE